MTTRQDIIDAFPDPAAEAAVRAQIAREAFRQGLEAGDAAGYARAHTEMTHAWREAAAGVSGPSRAELEEARWGPGGRAHFADPRPGDYPGRKHEAEPQAEPEPEATA
jgi:hypothetical protein